MGIHAMSTTFGKLRCHFSKSFRALGGNFAASSSRGRRSSRRTRLEVEGLETRELLSATVPGFSLSGGNLYNTSGAQQQLIDAAVQVFAVVNNKVFDLHTNGTLESMDSDGSGKVTLDNTVQSFAIAGNGMVVRAYAIWAGNTI
jgi:hypothetical protein